MDANPSPIASVPGVAVGPGETALTRTPFGPYSAAHALVSSAIAAFEAPYAESPAIPNSAAIVVTLMIVPPPRATIFGAIAAVSRNGALTLTANVSSNVASESSWVAPTGKTPALLTRMSTSALGECVDMVGRLEISAHELRLATAGLDRADHLCATRLAPAADQDTRSLARERFRRRATDARSATGDQSS